MRLIIDDISHDSSKLESLSEQLIQSDQHWHQDVGRLLKEWRSDEQAITMTTSGSTGRPKHISHLKSAMRDSAEKTGSYFNLSAGTTALACLPYTFIAGKMMIIRAMVLGWDLIISKPSSNPLRDLDRRIDFIALTPHQLSHILEENPDKLQFVEKILLGGGPVSPSLQKQIYSLNNKIFIGYGMTETITHIAVKRLNGTAASDVYQALPGISFQQSKDGSLIISADHLPDTLFTTDIVKLYSTTSFIWLGRMDNIINSGGIKVYPEKIERQLSAYIQYPFFVYGVPDDLLGERVELFIEANESDEVSDISQHFDGFTGAERPRQVHHCTKFTYTKTGKIRRKETVMQTLKT